MVLQIGLYKKSVELNATFPIDGPEKTVRIRYGTTVHAIKREPSCIILILVENFSGSLSQDKHNASIFQELANQLDCKNRKKNKTARENEEFC